MECHCYRVYRLRYKYFKLCGRHLDLLTSAYLLIHDYHLYNTREMSVLKINGVAVGILFLTSVELKLYCMLYAVHNLYLLLPVLSRHIGYLVGARLVLFSPSCSPIIFGKSHQSVRVNSKRFKNGGSKCRSRVFFIPPGGRSRVLESGGPTVGSWTKARRSQTFFFELHVAFGAF